MANLPDSNPKALSLCLTDSEFAGIVQWLRSQAPLIESASVFGSRHAGARREKDDHGPPDIDLAVQLRDDEDWFTARMTLQDSLTEFIGAHPEFGLSANKGAPSYVDVQFPDPGSWVHGWILETGSTRIFPAP